MLRLIAEFDPFLATRPTMHRNPGRRKTSYLSSTICDFILATATEVRSMIFENNE